MPATIRRGPALTDVDWPIRLGPLESFPETGLSSALERRWLHYAFMSRDNELGMVANIAWLGQEPDLPQPSVRNTSILTVYRRGEGWRSSQFNCQTFLPLWSAFRQPHTFADPQPFHLASTTGTPFVQLTLQRSCRPATGQCALFAGESPTDLQHIRWQPEPGIIARGDWGVDGRVYRDVEAVGYQERARGRWGWQHLGGWVWGFVNDPTEGEPGAPPPTSVVFGLIQPAQPPDAAAGSIMLWRNGRMRRCFPRRRVSLAVRGQLDRDHVVQVPEMANLFNVPAMQPIPRRLMVVGRLGDDWISLDFLCEEATRVVVPNEIGLHPFSVHEVVGRCQIEGQYNGQRLEFETYGIVEFAGGAGGD